MFLLNNVIMKVRRVSTMHRLKNCCVQIRERNSDIILFKIISSSSK